jgi:hypothetical protein
MPGLDVVAQILGEVAAHPTGVVEGWPPAEQFITPRVSNR